jgi:hypothetical protein
MSDSLVERSDASAVIEALKAQLEAERARVAELERERDRLRAAYDQLVRVHRRAS